MRCGDLAEVDRDRVIEYYILKYIYLNTRGCRDRRADRCTDIRGDTVNT